MEFKTQTETDKRILTSGLTFPTFSDMYLLDVSNHIVSIFDSLNSILNSQNEKVLIYHLYKSYTSIH